MKLSKLINKENLNSITIHVKNEGIFTESYFLGRSSGKPIKKKYKSIDVDIDIPKVSNYTVKHLGIKEYYHLVTPDYYINLYYY